MQRTVAFRIVTALGAAALAVVHGVLLLPAAGAATVAPPAVTALAVQPLSPVHPVTGSDARLHLAYELQIANTSSKTVTVDSVDVVDPGHNDAVLTTIGPDLLKTTLRVNGIGPGFAVLPPGVGAFLFVDVSLAPKAGLPRTLQHHFTYHMPDLTPIEFTGVSEKVVHDSPVVVVAAVARAGLDRRQRLLRVHHRGPGRDAPDRRHRARPRALRDRLRAARPARRAVRGPDRPELELPLPGRSRVLSRARADRRDRERAPRADARRPADGHHGRDRGRQPHRRRHRPRPLRVLRPSRAGIDHGQEGTNRQDGSGAGAAREHRQLRRRGPALPRHGRPVAAALERVAVRVHVVHRPGRGREHRRRGGGHRRRRSTTASTPDRTPTRSR